MGDREHDAADAATTGTVPTTSPVPTTPVSDPPLGTTQAAAGAAVTVFAVDAPSPDTSGDVFKLKAGYEFADIDVKVCNVGGTDVVANPGWWTLQMPDDTQAKWDGGGRTPDIGSSSVSNGQCVRGWVTFEIPAGARPSTIIWTATDFKTTLRWQTTGSTTTPPTTPPAAAPPGTAAPHPQTVYTVSGRGTKVTPNFIVPTTDCNVDYTYDCSNAGGSGIFAVTLFKGTSEDALLVNEVGAGRTDSSSVHDGPGTYYLSVLSECDWTIKVVTAP